MKKRPQGKSSVLKEAGQIIMLAATMIVSIMAGGLAVGPFLSADVLIPGVLVGFTLIAAGD